MIGRKNPRRSENGEGKCCISVLLVRSVKECHDRSPVTNLIRGKGTIAAVAISNLWLPCATAISTCQDQKIISPVA